VRWAILWAIASLGTGALCGQDPREIVRKSVELDQADWQRMKDYTWIARETDRDLDGKGRVKSEKSEEWETVILDGEPHRRMLERDGKPLSPADQKKEQEKLDKAVAKLEHETPEQKARRAAEYEKERAKDRDFLREVPDLYDFHLERTDKIDGHDVWVISAVPKLDYQPKRRDARPLLKTRARLWIDQQEYQWVRLEAETTATISFGLFLVRLDPGAKLVFEQTRVNDEVWLPKREFISGAGRLGLVKKLAGDEEVTWKNYRKFQVDSKIVSTQ
jgi:hypothetical protein